MLLDALLRSPGLIARHHLSPGSYSKKKFQKEKISFSEKACRLQWSMMGFGKLSSDPAPGCNKIYVSVREDVLVVLYTNVHGILHGWLRFAACG